MDKCNDLEINIEFGKGEEDLNHIIESIMNLSWFHLNWHDKNMEHELPW